MDADGINPDCPRFGHAPARLDELIPSFPQRGETVLVQMDIFARRATFSTYMTERHSEQTPHRQRTGCLAAAQRHVLGVVVREERYNREEYRSCMVRRDCRI